MKRALLLLAGLALLAPACSSSTNDSTSSTAASSAAVADTTAGSDTTTAGSVAGPSAAAEPAAAIVPATLCIDADGGTQFAYTNAASVPVVVELGAANGITGADPQDNPFVTFLFAPGHVSPAFKAYPEAGASIVWSLTGPDGVARTAQPDATTPQCSAELLTPTTPDPRTPAIEVTGQRLTTAGDQVEVDLRLTGVPETSVCSAGLQAEPTRIGFDDGNGGETSQGATSTRTGTVFTLPGQPGPSANISVAVLVVDQCSTDGVIASSWPGAAFTPLLQGVRLCVSITDGQPVVEISEVDQCPGAPPLTDGVRIRPG